MMLYPSSTPSCFRAAMIVATFACGLLPSSTTMAASTRGPRNIFAHHGRPQPEDFPLGLCEGDCRDDSECQEGLYCFQRDPNTAIPGCIGGEADNSRTDYCTDVASYTPSSPPTDLPSSPPSNLPSDVPSSVTLGSSSPPTEMLSPSSPPSYVPSKSPSLRPSRNPTGTPSLAPSNLHSAEPQESDLSSSPSQTPSKQSSASPTVPAPSQLPSSNLSRSSSRNIYAYYGRPPMDAFPLGLCEGDCRDDTECQDGLYCFQRGPNTPVPGCNGGGADASRTDYCTDTAPQPPTPAPTGIPAPAPGPTSAQPTVSPDISDLDPSSSPSFNPTHIPGHIFAYPGGPPSTAYPLSQCQGDCLWHEDCADGMFCFQRDAYEAVPGCIGGETDGTKTDYCTYIAPVMAPVEPPTANNFRIKMYWDDYYWQEEDFDRVWCMQCKNGCQEGEVMFLHYCAWDSARFEFVKVDNNNNNNNNAKIQIQVVDTDLCLKRTGADDDDRGSTSLELCNAMDPLQHWETTTTNGFDGEFFEFSQFYNGEDYCVTTHHHPKYGEILEMFSCDVARFDTTSYWTKY